MWRLFITLKKSFLKRQKTRVSVVGILWISSLLALAASSCQEEIDTSNRYTFTGHTIASFLTENEDMFSSFVTILQRGGKYNLMRAYGTYTCFAPTNDAIDRYLFEQDSIYKESLKPGSRKVIWTGVTSPRLEDLSDSMCVVISQTHIIPKTYLTTEMEGDVIPTMNLNDRYLTMSYGVDSITGYSLLFINGARVIDADEEVQNGAVHTIAAVMNPSSNTVPTQIENMKFLSIFSEALERTGLDGRLQNYKDFSYTEGDKTTLTIYNKTGCPYPSSRYYGYTAFVEPDSVFQQAGIYNIEDLYAKCREWYPTATNPDFRNPDNALNKFIAYHLLDRKLLYSRLVCYNITCGSYYKSESNLLKRGDRYDYFETMQGTMMKVTLPLSNANYSSTILINYTKDLNSLESTDITASTFEGRANVRIMNPSDVASDNVHYPGFQQEALNGSIHLIDKILVYDEDLMVGYVLNEIIRLDFSSLVPEYTNNNIRWCDGQGINFASGSGDYEFYIPKGYSDRLKYNTEETRLYYLSPHTSWANYQGDECMCLGAFDFGYRLPHVPAGTYELRMGYSANSNRGVIQFYVDDEVTGIPTDLRRLLNVPEVGWVADSQTDDNGVANDKQMKNRGWLKGPTTFYYGGSILARNNNGDCRRVITTKYLGPGDHWLRFKNVNDQDDGLDQFMHDYLEIVPIGWLRNEEISLEERRK